MENKSNKFKLLIIIAITIPVIIGLSYAYFLAVIKGGTSSVSGTSTSIFVFDLETENDGYINATGMYPIDDEDIDSLSEKGYFTVTTGANAYDVTYSVKLTNITIDSALANTDFRWELLDSTNNQVATGNFSGTSNGSSIVLAQNLIICPSSSEDYTVRIWYHNDPVVNQTSMINKSFSAKISVEGELTYSNPATSCAPIG